MPVTKDCLEPEFLARLHALLDRCLKEGGLGLFGGPGFHVAVFDMDDEWCRYVATAIITEWCIRLHQKHSIPHVEPFTNEQAEVAD